MKRYYFIGLLLIVTLFMSSCSYESPFVNVNRGAELTFGEYEQDGNLDNGSEPIEWVVVDKHENMALIVSKYVLDCQPYNTTDEEVTWENSSLRKWLNNDFLNTAFSEEDKKCILKQTMSSHNNAIYNVSNGKETKDRIFILDYYDWYYSKLHFVWDNGTKGVTDEGYDHNNVASDSFLAGATQYAKDQGVKNHIFTNEDYNTYGVEYGYSSDLVGTEDAKYWIRTPGDSLNNACYIEYGLMFQTNFENVSSNECGVRPALWIKTQ